MKQSKSVKKVNPPAKAKTAKSAETTKPGKKGKMLTLPFSYVQANGSRSWKTARGWTPEELLTDLFQKLYAKDNKRYNSFRKHAKGIDFGEQKIHETKYLEKNKHYSFFLKQAHLKLKKTKLIDVICMIKSKLSNERMAEELICSIENIERIVRLIFELLGVSSKIQAVWLLGAK